MKHFLFLLMLGNSFSLYSMHNDYAQAYVYRDNKAENLAGVYFFEQFGLNVALFANQPLFCQKSTWNAAQRNKISEYLDNYHDPLVTGSFMATIPLSLITSKYLINQYNMSSNNPQQSAYNLGMFAGLVANQAILAAGPEQTSRLPRTVKGALYGLSTAATLHEAHQQFKNSKNCWQNGNYLSATGYLTLSGLCVGAAALPFYLDYSQRKMS